MKKVRWIIQDKNYADDDRQQIIDACEKRGIPCVEISVIPFSDALPDFPVDDEYENIYYGSTTMMDRAYRDFNKPVGLFYDEDTFSMENYLDKWGEHMLSSEAEFMTMKEFATGNYNNDRKFFIRPDADSKSFAGVVIEYADFDDWYDKLIKCDAVGLGPDTKIMVGPAYNIEKEWRNYVVNGKVITSSMYRKNFKLNKDGEDIPEEMIKFVEDRCKEYTPHDVIAFDVAKCSGEHEYYIIECGCMNSVGFYHCDIDKYVEALTEYVEKL
jgi:hypothetical protein